MALLLPPLVLLLLLGSAVLLPGTLPAARAAVPTSCGAVVPIYGVAENGELHEWIDSVPTTLGGVSAVAVPVSTGWAGLRQVMTGGGGVLYTISKDGVLRWWRHTGTTTGAATWATGSGRQVGQGWQMFTTVVSVGGGVLYGVLPDGRLLWYRHLGVGDGLGGWASGSGGTVGSGWSQFTRIVPGGLGSLYAMTKDGRLLWYAHDGWQTGRAVWAAGSGSLVGNGWQIFTTFFSGSGGVIYGLLPDGTVRWYDNFGAATGTFSWTTGVLTGVDVRGHAFLGADPTVCTGLDRADLTAVRRVSSGILYGAGWSAAEFGCLSNIATKESGWRWNAGTLTGPYGIPQAVPASKMGTAGADWQGNPVTQVRWMLGYVRVHYSTPCLAWAFWQAHGYY